LKIFRYEYDDDGYVLIFYYCYYDCYFVRYTWARVCWVRHRNIMQQQQCLCL